MLYGIDVNHNDDVNWKEFKWDFIFTKATESHNFHDPLFKYRQEKTRELNIPNGPYHFYRPSDATEQAKWFCDFIGPTQKGDLPPVLDWEDESCNDSDATRFWLDYVENFTGQVPIIYGPQYLLQDLNLDPKFSRYPLWIAHPGLSLPLDSSKIPPPWKDVTFLQTAFAENGSKSGYDEDFFNGDIVALNALRKK